MKLYNKLLWLKMHNGLTVYLTDLDKPHHVDPEDLAALLTAIQPCDSDLQISNAYRAWRDRYTPDHIRRTEPAQPARTPTTDRTRSTQPTRTAPRRTPVRRPR